MLKPRRGGYESGTSVAFPNDRYADGVPLQQNAKTHTVYAFKDGCDVKKYSDDDGDDEGHEGIELSDLRTRNTITTSNNGSLGPSGMSKSEIVTHRVSKSDSLQGIALQYGCTMSEIKQANCIYKDQDLHALKHLKIPVHQFSLHLEEKRESKNPVSTATKSLRKLLDLPLPDGIENELPVDCDAVSPASCTSPGAESSTGSYGNNADGIDSFLKHVDKGINKACKNLDINGDSEGLNYGELVISSAKQDDRLGSICGISWRGFLVTLCFLAIVVPGLGLVYYNFVRQSKSDK